MFHELEQMMLSFAEVMPLPAFAAASSFLEEIVAPIPSGPVMLVMGSLASVQGYALIALLGLTLAAALGKLAGALVVYVIADKAEDLITSRFAKISGITHAQIESFGKRLGNGWRDYVLLTLLRMIPFVPSVVVSAGSGILKVPPRLYVISTFAGSLVRDFFFLYLGYVGLSGAEQLIARFDTIESVLQALIVLGVVVVLGIYIWMHAKKAR